MKKVFRRVIIIFLVLSSFYLIVVFGISYWKISKVLTTRVMLADDRPENYGLQYETISFPSLDGTQLSGWFMPAEDPKGIILLLHGIAVPKGAVEEGEKTSAGGKATVLPWAEFLVNNGYTVFAFDFRFQGESQGSRITFGPGEVKDIGGAVSYLKSRRELENLPIAIHGLSFGGAMGIRYTAEHPEIQAIIVTGTYADFKKQIIEEIRASDIRRLPLIIPIAQLAFRLAFGVSWDELSPKNFVGQIAPRPIFIIHSREDARLSVEHARELFVYAKEPKTLWELPGGSHAVIGKENKTPDALKEEYRLRILQFLDDAL